jgi:anthranilate phosphoribosyltransferase
VEVLSGETRRWTIHPDDHGFRKIAREDLRGSEPADNARVIVEILEGKASEGAVAATVLNAAAAIYVSGRVKSYGEGVAAAKKSIASGQAKTVLERLRRATTKPVRTST